MAALRRPAPVGLAPNRALQDPSFQDPGFQDLGFQDLGFQDSGRILEARILETLALSNRVDHDLCMLRRLIVTTVAAAGIGLAFLPATPAQAYSQCGANTMCGWLYYSDAARTR